jgi:hypothetical protein
MSLLQKQTVLQLEYIRPGEHTDCTLLTILRSLSYEQLEELRPDLVLHGDCDSTHCNRLTLAPLGNDVTPDTFSLSESIMNIEELKKKKRRWTLPVPFLTPPVSQKTPPVTLVTPVESSRTPVGSWMTPLAQWRTFSWMS